MQKEYYPDNKVVFGVFSTYSRYAGEREAIFTALCRKNYGCTHFIVGRDHTGVGEYYNNISNSDLFNRLGDIGIEIVFFDRVGYSKSLKMVTEKNEKTKDDELESISGTQVRNALSNGKPISEKHIRKEIVDYLIKLLKNNKAVFVT